MQDFRLDRFVTAQQSIYQQVITELVAGKKQSHWMWFIFPQIKGLGVSEVSREYAVASIEEAEAYLLHDVLGKRLRQCVSLVLQHTDMPAISIFGEIDAMKFHSSMSLFSIAASGSVFQQALNCFYSGRADKKTIELLNYPA